MRVDVFVWGDEVRVIASLAHSPSSTLAGGGRPGEEGAATLSQRGKERERGMLRKQTYTAKATTRRSHS